MSITPPLRLHLLGPFSLVAAQPMAALRRKDRALLAYLAVMGKAHQRRALVDLFFQQADAPSRALAVLLSRVRSQLGAAVFLGDDERVQLNERHVWVDVRAFQEDLSGDLATRPLARLEGAVSLYRSDLLDGLSLSESPEFELWLMG